MTTPPDKGIGNMTLREFKDWLAKLPAEFDDVTIFYIDAHMPSADELEARAGKDGLTII